MKTPSTPPSASSGSDAGPTDSPAPRVCDGERPRTTSTWSALLPLVVFVLVSVVLLTLSRLGLSLWQRERVAAAGSLTTLFAQGLRFDLVTLGLALLAPSLIAPVFLANRWTLRPTLWAMRIFFAATLTLLFFMEMATPAFLEEYDSRPNYLFVEYLEYPREVLATLWGAYPIQLILSGLLVPLVFFASLRLFTKLSDFPGPIRLRVTLPLTLLLPLLSLAAARSTLEHRPVNPSNACYSSDAMVNSLPLSSLYSVAYAIYETRKNERPGETAYGRRPYEDVLEIVRAASGLGAEVFGDPEIPTLHRQHVATPRARPLNFVIILEESLGAEFVGAMGGLPLTPNLDALLEEGLTFDQLYATGTRSVRGIEAVVTGFLPTPTRSVVKLPRSQRNFFTVAEVLARAGYGTSFLYGGEAHFDNMRRFFSGNGFGEIIDHSDFGEGAFEGSWGVSDEDLFRLAHEHFEAQGERPFFSLVFSSSNHSPWDFPLGDFELYEEPAATRNNAVKYADHALGVFFDLARGSSYWDNTVFLVVADHNSRVYGPALVPVEHFHIPATFLGGTIGTGRIPTLASQIDLFPTAFALMGFESSHPGLGRDLTDPRQRERTGRAILQFNDANLYLTPEHAVLHRPHLPTAHLRWTGATLVEVPPDEDLERIALAHALWPQMSYPKGDYRLPTLGLK